MRVVADKPLQPLAEMMNEFMGQTPKNALQADAQRATRGMELELGTSDSDFDISSAMSASPLYVDPAMYGGSVIDGGADVVALVEQAARAGASKADLSRIAKGIKYNRETGKFDFVFRRAGVSDAAPDLISAQLAGPGAVSYFTDIFKRPLVWSNATKHVEIYTGTNPWAEVMSLITGDFSGFAALLSAGGVGNNMSADVEYQAGMMTQAVINASVSYRVSIEELERSKNPASAFPFNGQPIATKMQYANWALDMIRDYSIIFGIPQANINGLSQVNGVTAWPGSSLSVIAAGGSSTKGQDMFIGLAQQLATLLTTSQNMLSRVRVGMSPLALNLLGTYPYSATYNPQSALKTLVDNFLAGEGKSGMSPDIEIFSDPLLSAGTIFNPAATDILIISAPEIVGGPDETKQALIRFGMPLPKFPYPVFPGMQGTPYKTLSRISGVFAPYGPAIKMFYGFGV